MNLKFAIPDYTFPKLEWRQALRLARDLGAQAVDIGLFAGRSHLRPEDQLVRPAEAAACIAKTLSEEGLEIADVFGQPAANFETLAVNHPDREARRQAGEFFERLLELAARVNARHVSLLPGARFEQESAEDSLNRAGDELSWRMDAAAKLGIALAVEAHVGSLIPTPSEALRLLGLVPGLTLTLDYGHFTCQGIADSEVEPLIARSSHFHARAASEGKLQAPFSENAVDFARILRTMAKEGYSGYICLEYVWSEWMRCNEVDNVSETVLLRDYLRSIAL